MVSPEFPSKRDGWLIVVIWLAVGLLIGTAWLQVGADETAWLRALLVALQLAGAAFMLWVLYGTGYRIEARHLCVRGDRFAGGSRSARSCR